MNKLNIKISKNLKGYCFLTINWLMSGSYIKTIPYYSSHIILFITLLHQPDLLNNHKWGKTQVL